jgi:oligopeptide/dipeptide ABC transporter ATP-binding protein
MTSLLSIRSLRTVFRMDEGEAVAVDDVSLDIPESGTVGLVGESGCGKSVTALSIMRLVPQPQGKIAQGSILFRGEDLLRLSDEKMRRIRGDRIAMIFQDPMTSLNPVYRCGDQIAESIVLHRKVSKKEGRDRAIDLLRQVGIPQPGKVVDDYPHQLSGGMRQRVMIAMAIACDISLLIADEPTTALDVTVQAQILELLVRLQREKQMALLLITHDLGLVAENTAQVAVMYAGKIQESVATAALFSNPKHPYTQGLMRAIPNIGEKKERLLTIPGTVPSPLDFPAGCRFHPRCPHRFAPCDKQEPELRQIEPGHCVRCFLYEK